jgi:hypothetical protein
MKEERVRKGGKKKEGRVRKGGEKKEGREGGLDRDS